MAKENAERPSCMFAKESNTTCSFFSQEPCKRKRKRVHIPHSKRPKEFVVKRNSKERQRVGEMATAFEALLSVLPSSTENSKPSRSDILREAINYIRDLEKKLTGTSNSQACAGRGYCTKEIQKGAFMNIWVGNRMESTNELLNSTLMHQTTVDRRMELRDFSKTVDLEPSNRIANSFLCESGPLMFLPRRSLEPTWDVSTPTSNVSNPTANVSESTLDGSQTVKLSRLSESRETSDSFIYTQRASCGVFNSVSNTHTMSDSHCYTEFQIDRLSQTRRKLGDITNWNLASTKNRGLVNPLVSGERGTTDNGGYLPKGHMEMYGVQSDSEQADISDAAKNQNSFFSIW